jgi:DNA polymerase delta subunit 4
MPTTRRKSANTAAASKARGAKPSTRNQTKLAFHGQVSKQITSSTGAEEKAHAKTDALHSPAAAAVVIDDLIPEPTAAKDEEDAKPAEQDVQEKDGDEAEVEMPTGLKSLDLEADELTVWRDAVRDARDVSDARIESYWAARDAGRTTERVHQEGMSVYEKMLGDWDIDSRWGVSYISFLTHKGG